MSSGEGYEGEMKTEEVVLLKDPGGSTDQDTSEISAADHLERYTTKTSQDIQQNSSSGNSVHVSENNAKLVQSKSAANRRNLEIVGLDKLEIGHNYECQGRNGDWYPITVTAYDEESKRYQATAADKTGATFKKLRASQCVEAAPPEPPINWLIYFMWRIIEIALTAAWVAPVIIYWDELYIINEYLPGIEWYGFLLVFPILCFCRLFWLLVWPRQKEPKSVNSSVAKMVEMDNAVKICIIGTLHVSPGSVRDVSRVADEFNPDAYLIELDRARLDAMRERNAKPEPVTTMLKLTDYITTKAVHSEWNGLMHKKHIEGSLIFSEELQSTREGSSMEKDDGTSSLSGKILVAPLPKELTEMYITIIAQKRGAAGVLFVDTDKTADDEPSRLILSVGGFWKQTGTCCRLRSAKLPEIPAYLIPGDVMSQFQSGQLIVMDVNSNGLGVASRATKMWCRACVIYGSGLGILYGLMRLAGVKAGGEFLISDDLAAEQGKPCVTIDMSMERLGHKICKSITPTPRNILKCILAWLAFTRIVLSWFLLPMPQKLDLALNMCMGFGRFRPRTWFAFLLGTLCSGLLITGIVLLLSYALAAGAREAASGEEDKDWIQNLVFQLVGISINLWFFPGIYYGLLDSRDEQMYRGIVAQIRARPHLKKFVVVIGAAHSNGILRRLRSRGI